MYRSVAGFYDDVLGNFNATVTNLEVVWVLQAFTSNWLQRWNFHSSSTPKLYTEASEKVSRKQKYHPNDILIVCRFLFGRVFFCFSCSEKHSTPKSDRWVIAAHHNLSDGSRNEKNENFIAWLRKVVADNHKVPSRKRKKNPFPQINNQKSSRSHVYKGEASHKAPPLIIFTIGCFTSFISSVARRFRLFFIPRLYAIAPVACRDDMPSRPFASLTETPEKCLSMSVPSNNDRLCRQDLNLKKIK